MPESSSPAPGGPKFFHGQYGGMEKRQKNQLSDSLPLLNQALLC